MSKGCECLVPHYQSWAQRSEDKGRVLYLIMTRNSQSPKWKSQRKHLLDNLDTFTQLWHSNFVHNHYGQRKLLLLSTVIHVWQYGSALAPSCLCICMREKLETERCSMTPKNTDQSRHQWHDIDEVRHSIKMRSWAGGGSRCIWDLQAGNTEAYQLNHQLFA